LNKRILAVFDGEESYAYRLMDFISEKENVPFEIHVFTKADIFFSYAEKEEIECLLISESAYQQEVEKLKIPQMASAAFPASLSLSPSLPHAFLWIA